MRPTQVNYYHWNMKNIPALKIEKFISAASNYADKLGFSLLQHDNGESTHDIAGDWTKTADFLYNHLTSVKLYRNR